MSLRSFLGAMLVVVVLIAIVAGTPDRTDAEGLEVTNLTMTPDPAIMGGTVEIACKLVDETGVVGVYLRYCSDTNCFPPIAMAKDAQSLWRASTYILDSTGQYHFNITVEYSNGTFGWTEEHLFTPVEPTSTVLETTNMSRIPQEVKVGEAVDILCAPKDAANITAIEVRLKQGGTPLTAVPMTKLANGTYKATIGPFDSDRQVTYNITATLASGGKAWTSDLTFTPKGSGDGDDDGFLPALGAAAVVAVMMGLAVTYRGRKAKRAP